MVKKILGDCILVEQYDKCHKRLKAYNNSTSRNYFKNVLALVEVKLKNIQSDLKKKQKSIEINRLVEQIDNAENNGKDEAEYSCILDKQKIDNEENKGKDEAEYSCILDKQKIIDYLLRQWKL